MPKDTAPGPGHNSEIEINEADFLKFFSIHSDLEAELEALNTKKKKLRKQMRAAGIRLTEFDTMLKLQGMKRDDVQDHFIHLKHYMDYGRVPYGTQFSFDLAAESDEPTEEEIIAKATDSATSEGFLAGLKNKPATDNPHDGNSPAGQAWIQAHHDGLAQREHELSVDPMSDDDDADDD